MTPLDLSAYRIHLRCSAPVDPHGAEPEEAAFDRWQIELHLLDDDGDATTVLTALAFRLRPDSETDLIEAADAQVDMHFLDRVCIDGLTEHGDIAKSVREALDDDGSFDVLVIGRFAPSPAPPLHHGLLGRAVMDRLAGPGCICFFEAVPEAPDLWASSVGAVRVDSLDAATSARVLPPYPLAEIH